MIDRLTPSNDDRPVTFDEVLRAAERQKADVAQMTFEQVSSRVKEILRGWFAEQKEKARGETRERLVQLELLSEGLIEDFDAACSERNSRLERGDAENESFPQLRDRVFVHPYMGFATTLAQGEHSRGTSAELIELFNAFEKEFGGRHGLFQDYLDKAQEEDVQRRRAAVKSV